MSNDYGYGYDLYSGKRWYYAPGKPHYPEQQMELISR